MAEVREKALGLAGVGAALESGAVVGGTAGLARAAIDLALLSALPTLHQVVFAGVTWGAWTTLGALVSGICHVLCTRLPLAMSAPRAWSGWSALVAFLAIDLGVGEFELEQGARLVCLCLSGLVLGDLFRRVGNRLPRLQSRLVWAVAGQLLAALCAWRIVRSPPADHGSYSVALGLLAGPFVTSLPALLRLSRASVASAAAIALLCVALPAATLALLSVADGEHADDAPSVLLVTIDTLRADAVGCYGGSSASTPTLDRLAAEGVLFEDARSPIPMTYPSHTSVLSGLYPKNHGVLNNMPWPLAPGVETLPELFANRGYRTAAFVSGFTLKREAARLHQRFQLYDDTFGPLRILPDHYLDSGLVVLARHVGDALGLRLRRLRYGGDRPAERCIASAAEWIEDQRGPFFMWVHLFDPHLPYEPPAHHVRDTDAQTSERDGFWYRVPPEEKLEIVQRERDVERLRALYRGEVSYADEQVGVLLEALRSTGSEASTLVIATSDHGESLGEHDYWFDHSYFLYETCLRVPLLLRIPERLQSAGLNARGVRVTSSVRLIDVAPTLIDLLSLERPERALDGISLKPLLETGAAAASHSSAAYGVTYDLRADRQRYLLSVREGDAKYVRTAARWDDLWLIPEREELFDVRTDPGEDTDLSEAPGSAEQLARLRALADVYWREWAPSAEGAQSLELSEGSQEQLEAIGY